MSEIDNTTQLELFETIRDALLQSSEISRRFSKAQFDEYEPNLKSASVKLPFIVITPDITETDLLTTTHATTEKSISYLLDLLVDYKARSKAKEIASDIVRQIEASEDTFLASGYYNPIIDLSAVTLDVIDQRQVVRYTFFISFFATVDR